jgi:hypothetical protein
MEDPGKCIHNTTATCHCSVMKTRELPNYPARWAFCEMQRCTVCVVLVRHPPSSWPARNTRPGGGGVSVLNQTSGWAGGSAALYSGYTSTKRGTQEVGFAPEMAHCPSKCRNHRPPESVAPHILDALYVYINVGGTVAISHSHVNTRNVIMLLYTT